MCWHQDLLLSLWGSSQHGPYFVCMSDFPLVRISGLQNSDVWSLWVCIQSEEATEIDQRFRTADQAWASALGSWLTWGSQAFVLFTPP